MFSGHLAAQPDPESPVGCGRPPSPQLSPHGRSPCSLALDAGLPLTPDPRCVLGTRGRTVPMAGTCGWGRNGRRWVALQCGGCYPPDMAPKVWRPGQSSGLSNTDCTKCLLSAHPWADIEGTVVGTATWT